MLFPSCSMILLFPLLSSPHGSNKVVLDPSCTWIRCTRVSSWYSNGPFNSDLVETFKTNAFNVFFNAFVLDRVIGPFGTCNGSLLVFLGWSTSPQYYRTDSRLIYSLPCSPLIIETKGKGSHPCCFQVVVGFFCFLCCPHLMAQIRLYWTSLAHG